ncbi:hypothetical protein L1987_08217 [Smallanthus sonchifolius]|uniref:Uncharacterized protein n=1 Tax=Smallanthus sonchifolius TaxID=185202 RepID=A0ACB9JKG2_9ASTR|nr:hypothetical protein L1987_08217 [Smallanthus sonchifolius]
MWTRGSLLASRRLSCWVWRCPAVEFVVLSAGMGNMDSTLPSSLSSSSLKERIKKQVEEDVAFVHAN